MLTMILYAVAAVLMGFGMWLVRRNRAFRGRTEFDVTVWKGALVTDAQVRRAHRQAQLGSAIGLIGGLILIAADHADFIAAHIHF